MIKRISIGRACLCGPGFCASARGIGFFGVCSGSRTKAGPDNCPICTAPHQSDAGCWLCTMRSGNDPSEAQAEMWLRMLRMGISGQDLFPEQDRRIALGQMPLLEELLSEIEAGTATWYTRTS